MRAGLVSLLVSRPSIRAFVDSRVFVTKAPQGATLPYIVITQMGSDEYGTFDGTSELRSLDFDIDCKSKLSTESDAIAKVVRNFLKDYKGAAGSEAIAASHFRDELTNYEPPTDGSDVGVHVTLLDFRIQYHPS